jgi:receptor protein-tyrosine kinase
MARESDNRAAPAWLRPAAEQSGLSYYVDVIRERFKIVIAVIVITVAAAAAYLAAADNVYEGEARLLVTPAPADDALLASLGVLRESNDPTRNVETVATLVTSLEVAERAKRELGTDEDADSLLDDVEAEPVASSDLVTITAQAATPEEAADLANAFANGLVDDRTAALHTAVDRELPQREAQLRSGSEAGLSPDTSLESEVARLRSLQDSPDPTVRVETEAVPEETPVSPRKALTIVSALLVGTVLGIAGAFTVQTLDSKLRREQQLRSRYNLPILARIPKDASRKGRPLSPGALAPPTREAYRTLRANVAAARGDKRSPQAVLVAGSSPSEGKTTTAINLAGSFALGGYKVILIEADLRRPAIGNALGVRVDKGVVSTLLDNSTLDDALVTTEAFGPSLQLLLADYKGAWMSELFSLHAAKSLLEACKQRADYVIIDSPPLTTVIDALPLAREADDVLIVARMGVTDVDKLPELAELLASNDIKPLGFALIGTEQWESYYYRGEEDDAEPPPMGHGGLQGEIPGVDGDFAPDEDAEAADEESAAAADDDERQRARFTVRRPEPGSDAS